MLAGLVSTEALVFGLKMAVFWCLHMAFPLYVYVLISLYKMELRPTHRTSLPPLLFFFFFYKKDAYFSLFLCQLASPGGMWDLSYRTRDQTPAPCNGSAYS